MAIFRVEKNNNYTVMSNYHFREKDMSLKAKGLLSLMLSLPNDWDYSIKGLVSYSKDSKDSVMSGLKELEEFGYLKRTIVKNDKGQFDGYDYNVFEKPQRENPYAENPNTENPNSENPTQLNTNILNTNKLNTNNKKETYKEKFETFYKAYPRKVGKANVEKWFTKNKPNDELFELIMRKLEMFKKSPDWFKNNGQFIPYPTTWLNQKRWEDEISTNGMNVFEEDYSAFKESTMSEEDYIRKAENGGKKYV